MNKRETISAHQLAVLFYAFMTGSAIINIPAPITALAQNGAWISLIIAIAAGFLFLACMLYLHRQYPTLTFVGHSREILGKYFTMLLFIPFVLFLMLLVSYIVIDIGAFFTTTMLRETPSYVFHLLILMIASLTARAGIEVMARMFPLLVYLMLGFTMLVLVFAYSNYHPEYLLPIMPSGIGPVLEGAYFLYGFPYGEIVVFAMLLPFVQRKEESALGKYMGTALLVNGLSLIIVTICSIMTAGPYSGEVKFSVFLIARVINVQDFVERVESVISLALVVASYMKTTIALFALNLACSQLLRLQNDRILFFPLTMCCFFLTLVSFKHEIEFAEMIRLQWPLVVAIAAGLPALVTTGVCLVKKWFKR
ncbi:GerAB/ArcD/ProY family transporter [Paenibacillus sp. y28]|uniref:GerAB/ArcD/ProY family transporter n=1 Tax=Paenibacillus sp. y28 TaxID=3129110 RepID=UPI003018D49B